MQKRQRKADWKNKIPDALKAGTRIKNTGKTEDDKLNTNELATNAKLPKLVITKFQGTYLDWARFWNDFEAEIDTFQCSYLKQNVTPALCEKCPNTELFLVRIFPHLDWIRRDTEYLFVFSPNARKYGPEITPYLDIFHAVVHLIKYWQYSIFKRGSWASQNYSEIKIW